MKYQTKIFISIFAIASIGLVALSVATLFALQNIATEQFTQRYEKSGKIIAHTIRQIEESIEDLSRSATTYLDSYIKDHGVPSEEKLKELAVMLHVSQYTIANTQGRFIRDTVTPVAQHTKGLFDFCADYKKLTTGESKVEKTPIIPSFPYKGPFKFFMVPSFDRKYILESGMHIKEISAILLKTLKADSQIYSVGLYSPSGFSFGTLFQDGRLIEGEEKTEDASLANHLKVVTQVPVAEGQCCECKVKNVAGAGDYFYVLKMAIDTGGLTQTKNEIKKTIFGVLVVLLILSLFFSRVLSNILVRRIQSITSTIDQVKQTQNLNLQIPVQGKDEITFLSKHFNEMLVSLKGAQDSLIEHEKSKILVETANQVSHDIRAPVTALGVVVGTLKDIPEREKQLIKAAIQRILDIMNNLLDTSKRSQKKLEKTDMLEAVKSIVIEKRLQYQHRKNLQVKFSSIASEIYSVVDPVEVKRALSNLIDNAAEALFEKEGVIEVSLDSSGDQVAIEIKDNGVGISEENLKKLGQKGVSFGKDGASTSGSGLGIYHAKKTVEACGGELLITSKLGEGTVIRLVFKKSVES